MQRKYLLIPLLLAGGFSTYAQVSAVQNLNKNYQTGLELLDKEKYTAAAQALEWFEKTDPSTLSGKQRNEYQFKQGYAYFELKDYDKAEPLFEKVKKEDGDFQESATYYFAYINYLNKEYKTALANFEKLKGSPTYEASYPYYITSMYYLDERYDDVISYALASIQKTKQQFEPEMLSLVAASYFAKSEFKNAEKYFAEFYAKDKSETKNNLFIYQYGYSLFQNKKYKESVAVLEKLNTDDVYLQNGMHTLGKAFIQLGNKQKAQSAFFRASRLDFDKAIQEEAWLSYKFPEDNEIHALNTYWKAESMYELRKYGEAVSTFEKFLKMPDADKTGVYNFANYALAYAAFEDEKYSKAANYFEKFLQGNDKDQKTIDDATIRLADSYFVNKTYGNAMTNYNRIIDRHTTSEDYATFQKGMIQGLENQYDAKIGTMQTLLSKFPNSNYADDAGFETAYTYFNKGDFDKSKSDLVALVAKYPRSSYVPKALLTIGLVQYNQDQDDAALESFKKVIRDYPTADEAKQGMESIKNIYVDKGDANGFIAYA
ncbi:MAG: tetratricopeptide repeat protein, partial [Pedobacter sp.]